MNCRTFLAAATLLALAGCAGRWAEPVRVLSADADTIAVRWNAIEVSEAAARRKAVLHCGTRRAVDAQGAGETRRSKLALDLVRTKTWRCIEP